MRVKIYLFPIIVVSSELVYGISVKEDEMVAPHVDITNIKYSTSITDIITELHKKHINLDINWNFPKLIDNSIIEIDGEQTFVSLYGYQIPASCEIKGAHILQIDPETYQQNPALQKILCT